MLSPAKIVDALELRKLGSRKWHVQGACAVNGEGIYEAMETMARLVKAAKTHYWEWKLKWEVSKW